MHKAKFSIKLFLGIIFLILTIIAGIISYFELREINYIENFVKSVCSERYTDFMKIENRLYGIQDELSLLEQDIYQAEFSDKLSQIILTLSEYPFSSEPEFQVYSVELSAALSGILTTRDKIAKADGDVELAWGRYLEKLNDTIISAGTIDEVKDFLSIVLETSGFSDQHMADGLLKDSMPEDLRQLYSEYIYALDSKKVLLIKLDTQWVIAGKFMDDLFDTIRQRAYDILDYNSSQIQNEIASAKNSNSLLMGLFIVIMLLSALIIHKLVVSPLSWASRQLKNIQDGGMEVSVPGNIYIKELADISEMFDMFSEHLIKLYAHANQLEEDAAAKKDLEEIMRGVFKASMDGYFVWNSEHIEFVSAGVLDMLGLKDQGEFLKNWHSYGLSRKQFHILYDILSERGVVREELSLISSGGDLVIFEATHLIIHFHSQICILTYLRDLRVQKAHEDALKIAKEQAEMATKVKGDFLARMSHEIRTPMNGVLGLTQMALQYDSSHEQKELLLKIQSSAQLLLRIINDILDFSKIESGNLKLENTPFEFDSILDTVMDLIKPQAVDKGLMFETNYTGTKGLKVLGDPLRISQVMLNLASNAVKFTEKGNVKINIEVLNETENNVMAHFSVSDTGIGLTGEQLSKLFQPFSQADISTTRKYGGTGLGLMISKLILELMGGNIEIESRYGSGSTFSFILLFDKYLESENKEEGRDFLDSSVLVGKTILVAEDNAVNQLIIKSVLENIGVNVVIVNNGREAVVMLEEADFDCVLMDIQMPVMDGLTAAVYIREHGREAMRNIPIIAMTAHAMQADIDKSIEMGMNAHLTKPIDFDDVKCCLIKFLS